MMNQLELQTFVVLIGSLQQSARVLGIRVVSVLDLGALRRRRARVQIAAATLSGKVSGKLFTPIVPQFTKQQN